jgi:hypothetical protein
MEISNVTVAVGASALLVGVGVGFGIGAAVFAGSSDSGSSAATTRHSYDFLTTTSSVAATPDLPPPVATDFAVDVAITEQKCFGSAGCNYKLSINPRYVGTRGLSDNSKYLVTYEILGGEDPQTGNFRIDGTNIRWDQEKSMQGDQGATFTAKVTQILPQY